MRSLSTLGDTVSNKRYDISQVKYTSDHNGPGHFFSRSTLRFHGDKVAHWGVRHVQTAPDVVEPYVFIRHKYSGQLRRVDMVTGHISTPLRAKPEDISETDWERLNR